VRKVSSLVGHAYYGGDIENLKCQNQKHYLKFTQEALSNLPNVYSPCNGTIFVIREEFMGTQIELQPDENPDYSVIIFHIDPGNPFTIGDHFTAGELLGTHFTHETYSDIAVRHNNILSSAFEHMTDKLLAEFNLTNDTLSKVIISEEERDLFPSDCTNHREQLPAYKGNDAEHAPADWYLLEDIA